MKKRILTLLVAVCVSCSAIGLAACVPDGLKAHTWSEDWKHTIDNHWHYCLDNGCSGKHDETAHNLVLIETYENREATCGKAGRGVWKCVDCGVTIEDKIEATGEHNYELAYEDVPASCFEEGEGTYVCKDCGDVITKKIEATGDHTYIEGKWVATANGHEQRCETCKVSSGIIPHIKVLSEDKSKPATATNDGVEIWECEVCGYEMEKKTIPATNVPVELSIMFGEAEVKMGDDGFWHVTLKQNQRYKLGCTATLSNGNDFPLPAEWWTFEDAKNGVRAYLIDGDYNEKWLSLTNDNPVQFMGSLIEVKRTGLHMVAFRYETGTASRDSVTDSPEYSDKYRARAEFIVYIDCV